MSEKRFYKLNSRFVDIEEPVIYDNFEQKALNIEQSVELLNKLYEENEQLRKELDNFKPVMFQDVRKGTVILYSKGD